MESKCNGSTSCLSGIAIIRVIFTPLFNDNTIQKKKIYKYITKIDFKRSFWCRSILFIIFLKSTLKINPRAYTGIFKGHSNSRISISHRGSSAFEFLTENSFTICQRSSARIPASCNVSKMLETPLSESLRLLSPW